MIMSSNVSHPIDPLRFCRPSADERRDLIARRAYFRAMSRGFEPGHALDDWLVAEADLDREASAPQSAPSTNAAKKKPSCV
jgi:Protein of unknown function (DUF2934)